MLQNQNVFGGSAVARGYATQSHLQPAEETILRLLLPHLPAARMLDLGVGGGRTTLHFAKWVREYVGTDYAAAMITECEQRFAGYPNHISFQAGDARAMPEFATGSFDFVLFSFNGIDCVSHEDRLQILKEIRRVGKPGGYFCFSSHNLNWAANLFELRRLICLNPKWAVRTAKRIGLRFLYNWGIKAAPRCGRRRILSSMTGRTAGLCRTIMSGPWSSCGNYARIIESSGFSRRLPAPKSPPQRSWLTSKTRGFIICAGFNRVRTR